MGARRPTPKYRHPDAANFNAWRRHLLLADPSPPDELLFAWEDVKAMFNGGNRKKVAAIASISANSDCTAPKRICLDPSATAPISAGLLQCPPVPIDAKNAALLAAGYQNLLLRSMLLPARFPTIGTTREGWMDKIASETVELCSGRPWAASWAMTLKNYLEKANQGIYLPPPPPPPPT